MSHFVLVHGSFHGAWSWERLTPLLTAAGHRVTAPDLDGGRRGPDSVLSEVDGPAILVGHSSGGMMISEMARTNPGSATALVYLAGFMLRPGLTPWDLDDVPNPLFTGAVAVDRDAGLMTVRPELAHELFYHDCAPEDAARAIERLAPEILRNGVPSPAPAATADPVVDMRRFYIETLADRAINPDAQRRMYADMPCEAVYPVDSGHSPFLSAPHELARVLDEIAERV